MFTEEETERKQDLPALSGWIVPCTKSLVTSVEPLLKCWSLGLLSPSDLLQLLLPCLHFTEQGGYLGQLYGPDSHPVS